MFNNDIYVIYVFKNVLKEIGYKLAQSKSATRICFYSKIMLLSQWTQKNNI